MDKPPRVALVWRGDAEARRTATAESSRLSAIFAALSQAGFAPEPCVFDEAAADVVRAQLLAADAALVWVDPISAGRRRDVLDAILREAEAAGVLVSGRPEVIAKMGVKSVLYRTRHLGWGSDVWFYETSEAFEGEFPARVAAGPRVLKQNRGNGGIGVWKVTTAGAAVVVQEARTDAEPRTLALAEFMAERRADVLAGGLVDQAYQPRMPEGMVRCYMSGDRLVGFGHHLVRALAPAEAGPGGPRLYSGPFDPRFQRIRALMERDWTPGLAAALQIHPDDLPVIWDADLLLGPPTPDGEDSYVLCEINASAVFPMPQEGPDAIARTLGERLATRPAPAR
jgi:hypothetical protein